MNRCYNERGKTIQELLCQFTNKINENVNLVNSQEERIKYLLNQGVELEVAKKIDELYKNGELGKLINQGLLKDINTKIDSIDTKFTENDFELNKKIGEIAEKGTTTEAIKEATTQEIQKLLSQGQLAPMLIGKDSIDNDKLKNNTIEYYKNNFVEVASNNIFDNIVINSKAVNKSNGNIESNQYHSITNFIKVKANNDYSFNSPNGSIVRVAFYNDKKEFISCTDVKTSKGTFTTPLLTYFIVFQITGVTVSTGKKLQINEGGTLKEFDEYTLKFKSASYVRSLTKGKYPLDIISIKDFGAIGDGVKDDTTSINKCLQFALDNNISNVWIPQGTYLISNSLIVGSGLTLYGDGLNSKIKLKNNSKITKLEIGTTIMQGQKSNFYPIIRTKNSSSNIVIKGIHIEGNGTNQDPIAGTYEAQIGILLYDTTNSRVENCFVENVGVPLGGYGICVCKSTNSNITNNIVKKSGYENIAVRLSRYIIVNGNQTTDGGNHNIQISTEGGIGGCSYITVSNNILRNGKFITHGFESAPITDVVFSNNIVTNDSGLGIHILYKAERVNITNNTIHATGSIRVENEFNSNNKEINISNNNIRSRSVAIDVRASDTNGTIDGLIISSNNILYEKGDINKCVYIRVKQKADNIIVNGNTIRGAGKIDGICTERNTESILITNNVINCPEGTDIRIASTTKKALVCNNKFTKIINNAISSVVNNNLN